MNIIGNMSFKELAFLTCIIQIIVTVSAQDCNRKGTSCCYNEYFNMDTKLCSVCMNGSFGWNCESSCKKGFYGYLCLMPCACNAHLCDKRTGCKTRQNDVFPLMDADKNRINVNESRSFDRKPTPSEQDSSKYRILVLVNFGFVFLIMTVVVPATVVYFQWTIKRYIKRVANISSGRNETVHPNYCTLQHPTSSIQDLVNNEVLSSAYDELHCSYM